MYLLYCLLAIQVTPSDHHYFKEVELREEGGTPSIVGSIRAGLVVQLKETIGSREVMEREKRLVDRVLSKWKDIPEVWLTDHPCRLCSTQLMVLYTVGCGWSPFHSTAPYILILGTALGQWPIPPSQLCVCCPERCVWCPGQRWLLMCRPVCPGEGRGWGCGQ